MPRKAKENEELKEKSTITKIKSNPTNKSTKSNKTTKGNVSSKKVTSASKSSTNKKVTSKSKKEEKSKNAKKSSTKSSKTEKQPKTAIVEYYDLPQKYNQTIIKVLAQTPKTLFIYWEISDHDMEKYKKTYGENFFETTKPVLIIHNDTLNYSFEVEINDFANSWYLHINDSKSDYRIELGRRPIGKNETIKSDYIYITSSNEIESPNDHILFNNSQKMVYFRNIKTNQEVQKPVSTLSFMRNIGKIYDIYDLYKELYKNEDNLESLSNPSSRLSEGTPLFDQF